MKDSFVEEAKRVFKYRRISIICLYLAILFMVLGSIHIVFGIIGIGLLITFIVLSLIYWRCPSCNKGFEMRHGKMDKVTHCPYCGVKLREDEIRYFH